jgi:peptidoglycan hydrolase-like protein with peptidoglycan-binding domain
MNKVLATVTLGVMLAVPLVTTAAGADRARGNVLAAVDQLLAQDMIQQAQMTLQLAGFNPGLIDGIFDAQTSTAVRQYQVAQGLPASGFLDQPTRRALFPGSAHVNED